MKVNDLGTWRGETIDVDGVVYANGWGNLEYEAEDIYNRDFYEGTACTSYSWGIFEDIAMRPFQRNSI